MKSPRGSPTAATAVAPSIAPSASSVSTAHVDNMLKNYRHDQIVYALMTQLREKETEMAAFLEQRKRLQRKIDLDDKALDEKDRRIAVLENSLAREKSCGPSKKTEMTMKHLTETNAESLRILRVREDELSHLKPILKELKAKVADYKNQEPVQLLEQLGGELARTKEELSSAEHTNLTSNVTIEDLEKNVKMKQWMVKSLQEDSIVQRSKENHLLAHIKTLNEKNDTYETKFKGKGVDVPILLAKLKDYEVRVKHLQGKVRMLTNRKLNEPAPRAAGGVGSHDEARQDAADRRTPHEEADSLTKASSDSSSVEQFDEEEDGTFASNTSELEDHFHDPQSAPEQGFLGNIFSDFKVGIESLKVDLSCCAQGAAPRHPMGSPLSDMSPTSFDSQPFPSSSISRTFTPGSPSHEFNKNGTASPKSEHDIFMFV